MAMEFLNDGVTPRCQVLLSDGRQCSSEVHTRGVHASRDQQKPPADPQVKKLEDAMRENMRGVVSKLEFDSVTDSLKNAGVTQGVALATQGAVLAGLVERLDDLQSRILELEAQLLELRTAPEKPLTTVASEEKPNEA